MADLARGRRRATAGDDGDAIDRARLDKARRARNQAGALPFGQQRVFDPGRADDEGAAIAAQADELAPDASLRREIGDIEHYDLSALRDDRVHAFVHVVRREQAQVDQSDGFVGLSAQVKAKIGFGHRGNGMTGHHGMTVDAPGPPLIGREEIAERGIALQLRRADDERNSRLREESLADVDGPANAADRWARIEGRADLVVAECRAQRLQPCQRRRQVFFHPGRRFAAARTGEPDRANAGKPLALRLGRLLHEQNRRHASRGQSLHDVGGSGEVVAVVGEQQSRHQTGFAYFSVKLSIALTFPADGPS